MVSSTTKALYDEMHTISLNVVKNALLDLRGGDTSDVDWCIIDDRLDHIPWPSGKLLPILHCCLSVFTCNRVSVHS